MLPSCCARLRCLGWALVLPLLPAVAADTDSRAWMLSVLDSAGASVVQLPLPDSGRWCLLWNHSVQGFPVTDCFGVEDGQLILDSSQAADFAAGLGHTEGRGVLESDAHRGYRIVDMNLPISGNSLRLRVGSRAVDHRIRLASRTVSLSRLAADEAVEIRLVAMGKGTERE